MITANRLLPRGLRRTVLPLALVLTSAVLPAGARAATAGPSFKITSLASPSHFFPGDESGNAKYVILVTNTSNVPADGTSVTITDELPAGFSVDPTGGGFEVRLLLQDESESSIGIECHVGPPVTCTASGSAVKPGSRLKMYVAVDIPAGASGVAVNHVSVSGGGAADASAIEKTPITTEPVGFGFQELNSSINGVDGAPFTQAGGHPSHYYTGFQFNTAYDPATENPPAGSPKDILAKLPTGMVVNPAATSVRCTEAQLEAKGGDENECPNGSVVGIVHPTINAFGYADPGLTEPLFNMVPPPGHAAAFGFNAAGFDIFVHLLGGVNSAGEYEITSDTRDILQYGRISGFNVDLWGSPTDPSHDHQRGACAFPISQVAGLRCPTEPLSTALLTMPTRCSADPLTTIITADSWEEQGKFVTGSSHTEDSEGNPIGVDGCNALEFNPTIESKATTNLADSPTGLDFKIHQPQDNHYESLSTAALKDVNVTLPEGMTLNPSAGNGLGACTESQIGYQPSGGKIHFSEAPSSCPDASKLGTLEVNTPLLEEKIGGSIYLAKPYENPFGNLTAIYLAIESPLRGIVAKLAGKVTPDPQTGRLTAVFTENPQLPIEDIETHFFNGPRAALVTPLTCGTKETTTTMVPWSTPEGADAHPSDSYETTLGAGGGVCPASEAKAPNKPAFTAGTAAPQAGAYSPFLLKLSREDGTQRLTGIDTTLPEGLAAKFAGIPYCSEAQIAAAKSREAPNMGALEQSSPSCPAATEVGSVTVGAGAGITPLYVGGHAYLAGPYKGAPLSLAIITPAVAGPFDLGAVVVRTALYIDPETARGHAVSDPLPSIIAGVPLDIRSIAVRLDRPSFTLNPTSCDPMQITGSAPTLPGQSAALTSPFQVGGCSALKFAPKIAISLKGGTKRHRFPALKAVVTYPKGGAYANIASAQVTLPHSAFLEQGHIGTVCTRVQFAADACPKASIYGKAKAVTPLLDQPLEGPVYLRSSSHELPDLVAALNGQVDVVLAGRVDTGKGGGIRNTFEAVPDAPVSRFTLEMQGGKKGLLVNSEDICRKPQKATVSFTAQNGKALALTPTIKNSCGGKAKKKGAKKGSQGKKGHGGKK